MKDSLPAKESLHNAIHQLLKHRRKSDTPDLTLFTNLRLYRRLEAKTGRTSSESLARVRQLLEQALTTLQVRDEAAADLLRQRFLDNTTVQEMARRLVVSPSHYYNLQNQAINRLADVLLEQEEQARVEHRLAVEARLEPLTYRRLFGVDGVREQLRAAIERQEQPWLIALDGIGGIGKTSLADELVRDVVLSGRFDDIAWVSARQQTFLPAAGLKETHRPALDADTLSDTLLDQLDPTLPRSLSPRDKRAALTRLLKKRPYLVVVDNLETIADYQALLPALRNLADPTKFLLTSRHSLRRYSDIFCLSLPELSRPDALALLEYEAESRGLLALANASPAQLQVIYQVVGGNPLALKLVVGQICALPLSQVLENLKQARGKKVGDLYTYIYWQTWQALTAGSRQALLAMPLASPRGSTFAHLAAVSGLETAELSQALEELVAFSLVEAGDNLERRRYRIHRLTETFLLTEVAQWPSSP